MYYNRESLFFKSFFPLKAPERGGIMLPLRPSRAGQERMERDMRTKVLAIVIALLFVVLFLVMFAQRGGQRPRIVKVGDPAPEFSLPALDGRTAGPADFRGKVVMVHFWATWCPPCVEEIPTLEKLNRSLSGKDFVLLAVSVDEGGAAAVADFLKRSNITIPVLLDPDHAVASNYGTFKFPETYLVDRKGIVRNKIIGAVDWTSSEAFGLISVLLNEP